MNDAQQLNMHCQDPKLYCGYLTKYMLIVYNQLDGGLKLTIVSKAE